MAVHPNSLANLRPAQRGEVRNPEGVMLGALGADFSFGYDSLGHHVRDVVVRARWMVDRVTTAT